MIHGYEQPQIQRIALIQTRATSDELNAFVRNNHLLKDFNVQFELKGVCDSKVHRYDVLADRNDHRSAAIILELLHAVSDGSLKPIEVL